MRRLTGAPLLALLVAAAAACSDDGAGGTGPNADALRALVPPVDDLAAEGDGPTLSWAPVEGAVAYSVTVADDDGVTWMWVGEATEVEYGSLPSLEDGPVEPIDPDLELRASPDPDVEHRWVVTAFDADHQVLAMSEEQDLPAPAG